MRVAVIGTGSIGRRHLQNLAVLGQEVYGYDIDGAACRAAQDMVPSATVYNAEAVDEMDAWVIATPYHAHRVYVEQAIDDNIPFFVEKPIGLVDDLAWWAQASGTTTVHQVGYMLRFHEDAERLKAASGPVSLSVDTDMRNWPGQQYGEALYECSHEIDLALWFRGQQPVTKAFVDRGSGYRISLGEDVEIRIDPDNRRSARVWTVGSETATPTEFDATYRREMAHFLARVDGTVQEDTRAATLVDGVAVLETIAAVEALLP